MKRWVIVIGMLLLGAAGAARAQDAASAAAFARLSAKAEKAVDVTLDRPMLWVASQFLNSNDPQQAQAKKLVSKLQGVYVHSYQFGKPGEYSDSDVAPLRAPFQNADWTRVISARSKREGQRVEVYLKKAAGEKIGGVVVIAMEPAQLTFVNIVGSIDPEDLSKLGGQFGIPPVQVGPGQGDQPGKSPPHP